MVILLFYENICEPEVAVLTPFLPFGPVLFGNIVDIPNNLAA
jgi:hypothetical protein